MTDLVVRHDPFLLVAENPVFLLLTGDDHFHGFHQILLGHHRTSRLDGSQSRLVDHVGQIRSHGAGGCQGNLLKVHGIIHEHVLRMYFQRLDPAFQIRTLHDDPPVKPSRTKQRLVEDFRTVGGSQDHKTFGRIKTIHLRQQGVQRLFPLVVSSAVSGVTALTDGVHLIDENDTRRHGLGLLKQVTHTGRADADEHLHEVRTAQREERHIGLTGHRLGQQGLTGSRRAHQKSSLRQLGTDLCIFTRIVKEVHHLREGLLRLILSRHIRKCDAGLFLHIYLGVALADTAHHAAALSDTAHHKEHHGIYERKRKQPSHHNLCDQGRTGVVLLLKVNVRCQQAVGQLGIRKDHRVIYGLHQRILLLLRLNEHPAVRQRHTLDLLLVQHVDKFIIGDFFLLAVPVTVHHRRKKHRKPQTDHQHNQR